MSKLLIARHHESQWNHLGKWTGLRDIHLTEYGFKKSEEMGLLIKKTYPDLIIAHVFASLLVRSIETLSCILTSMDIYKIPANYVSALNERDYGEYTGKNKWDLEKQIGEVAFDNIRRGWDCPIPAGETLKMVYDRSVPFFISNILPLLKKNENILISSHGNTIRTLVKYIENISDEKIKDLEIPFGSVIVYDFDSAGMMTGKKILQVNSEVNA